MTGADRKEFVRLANEATEIIALARAQLVPIRGDAVRLLVQRIDHWKKDLAAAHLDREDADND
jgi:hypothetical protein